MVQYFGYFCALLIGMILGLMGGGGSILTVPVLVYIMGLNPVTATAYSLFIVGTTSAFGTFKNLRDGMVAVKTGLFFALPSVMGVYLSRMFIVPNIPDTLFHIGRFAVTRETGLMVLFALVTTYASYAMLRERDDDEDDDTPVIRRAPYLMLFLVFLTGILVGLVGAGGGFLFIPLLIYVAGLKVRRAIATSLLIITINSLIGFTGDLTHTTIDWMFLLSFSLLSVAGIYIGLYLSHFIKATKLKRAFGWFMLLMAVVILAEELF